MDDTHIAFVCVCVCASLATKMQFNSNHFVVCFEYIVGVCTICSPYVARTAGVVVVTGTSWAPRKAYAQKYAVRKAINSLKVYIVLLVCRAHYTQCTKCDADTITIERCAFTDENSEYQSVWCARPYSLTTLFAYTYIQ